MDPVPDFIYTDYPMGEQIAPYFFSISSCFLSYYIDLSQGQYIVPFVYSNPLTSYLLATFTNRHLVIIQMISHE
jgi:hypothetical protein